jgi:hypothetical protein
MANEIFIIKNISTNDIEIKDFGIIIKPTDSIDLVDFNEACVSDELELYLSNGDLVRLIDGDPVDFENAYKSTIENIIGPVSFLDLFKNTNQTLSTTAGVFDDIVWDGYHEINAVDYDLLAGNKEIQFKTNSKFLVMMRINVNQIGGNSRSDESHKLQLNTGSGYNDIEGTLGYIYSRSNAQGKGGDTVITVVDVSAGTKLKGLSSLNSGRGTLELLANGCSLTITNIKGQPGDTGMPGKDSSIIIEANSNELYAGSFPVLYFTGFNLDSSIDGDTVNINFSFDELSSLSLRKTSDFVLTTSWSSMTFDTIDISTGSSMYIESPITDKIYFNESGIYSLSFIATVTNTTTNTNSFTRFVLNDSSSAIPGTYSRINNYQGDIHPLITNTILNVSSGDYISIQAYRDETAASFIDNTKMSIFKLSGIKGDQGTPGTPGTPGPPGAGSSVVIKENGLGAFVANDLNFSGDVSITQDSSVANIEILTNFQVKNEGNSIGTVSNLNFIGSIISAVKNGDTADIGLTNHTVYGTEFQYSQDLTMTSTTSTSPQTKVTLNTPNLPSGTYKIIANWRGRHSSTRNDMKFDIALDGTSLGTQTIAIEPQDVNSVYPMTHISYHSLAGTHEILLRYWSESRTTYISDATVEFIRVN